MNTITENHYTLLMKGLAFIIALLITTSSYAGGVGFVNVAIVMQKAPQSISAIERLEAEFDKKDAELLELEDDIRKGEILLRRSSRSMDEERRERLQKKIVSMKRQFKERSEEFKEEFNERRTAEQAKIQAEVLEIIKELAKRKDFDIIVSEPVLYADDQVNLTNQVISILEEAG